MKPTILFATLSLVLGSPSLLAKSELETLRSLCKEQERQISQLEDDNAKLRSVEPKARTQAKAETLAPAAAEKAAPAKTAPAAAAPAPSSATYTVKAGDSFEKISRKVGSSPAKIAKANGLKTTSMIRPGQKLKVPGMAAPAAAAPATKAVAQATPAAPKSSAKEHKIMPGETFSSISKKRGISTAELMAANPNVKPSALRPGQMINLSREAPAAAPAMAAASPAPASSTPISTSSSSTPRSHALLEKTERAAAPTHRTPAAVPNNIPVSTPMAPKPAPAAAAKREEIAESKPAAAPESAPAPAPAASSTEKKIHPVTIDGEMTYGEFASKHGTDTERLNALNGLDLTNATVLAKGSELYVPAQP